MSELEKQLAKVVEKSLELAEKTGEFVLEQAPDLIQQFLLWHTVKHIFFIVIGIIIFLIGRYTPYLWLPHRLNKDVDPFKVVFFGKYDKSNHYATKGAYMEFYIASVIAFTFVAVNMHDLLYILIAPKIYIIDYFIR